MNDRIPLTPRIPGAPLRVLMIGRVSTEHQDIQSIDAGHKEVRAHLSRIYDGPVFIKELGDCGSGMRTDRRSIVEAEEEIASRTWDLVITPDLGRIFRNPRHLYNFVQDAVDDETRVIAIADNFDTADSSWHVGLGVASIQHGTVIPDTQRRVRQKARYDFHKGGMVQKVRYGYRKLTVEEAATTARPNLLIARQPECTPTIREMIQRVLAGDTYVSVARWLIAEGVDPGPYVTGDWTGRLVINLLRDPILSGTRTYGYWLSKTIFKTGKKRRRKNPDSPEKEHYAELAHITELKHTELIAFMDARASTNRNIGGLDHPLYDKPRRLAFWPAQHPRCAICLKTMYHFEPSLRCRGSFVSGQPTGSGRTLGPSCWNHVHVKCKEIRTRVLHQIVAHCSQIPEFRDALVDAAWSALQFEATRAGRTEKLIEEEITELENRSKRLAKAIATGGQLDSLLTELKEVNVQLMAARERRASCQKADTTGIGTREDVDRNLDEALQATAAMSYEFADLMRRVIPVFDILPVQALDSGLVRGRGKLVLRLSALVENHKSCDITAPQAGDMSISIDLFEPPTHIRAIPACLEAQRLNPRSTLDMITAQTGVHRMTVKRALEYAELMKREGLTDPYRELTTQPKSASRWKARHAS